MSVLRHRAVAAPGGSALLLCSARTWDEVPFREELLHRDVGEANLAVRFALTRDRSRRPDDAARRVDGAMLAGALAQLGSEAPLAYVCGSSGFVGAVAAALVALDLPAPRVRTERYGGK